MSYIVEESLECSLCFGAAESATMNYDEVLPFLTRGGFGKYQKKVYLLLCFPTMVCAFHKLLGVFLLAVPDHRCRLENEPPNATFDLPDDVWRSSIPFDDVKQEFSKCTYFRNVSDVVECTEYVWSTAKVENSVVTSFALVCNRATLRAAADSFLMIGLLIGSYVFGDLSDKWGRRPTFVVSLMLQVVFGLLTAVTQNFVTYTLCRMVR